MYWPYDMMVEFAEANPEAFGNSFECFTMKIFHLQSVMQLFVKGLKAMLSRWVKNIIKIFMLFQYICRLNTLKSILFLR